MERYRGNAEEIEEYAAFCAGRQVMEKMDGNDQPLRKKSVIHDKVSISIEVGGQKYLPDGTKVSAEFADNDKPVPSDTSEHEGLHAGADWVVNNKETDVEEVSIIPGPGYYGITKFRRLTRGSQIRAVMPHALGMDGTGFDMEQASRRGGVGSAITEARRIYSIYKYHFYALAQELEIHKTLTGADVDRVMKEADLDPKVVLSVVRPDGEYMEVTDLRSRNQKTVMVPGELITLPPPASNISTSESFSEITLPIAA